METGRALAFVTILSLRDCGGRIMTRGKPLNSPFLTPLFIEDCDSFANNRKQRLQNKGKHLHFFKKPKTMVCNTAKGKFKKMSYSCSILKRWKNHSHSSVSSRNHSDIKNSLLNPIAFLKNKSIQELFG